MRMGKKESTANMKVFQNFTSKFPENMVRDEAINRSRSDCSRSRPKQNYVLIGSLSMLPPAKIKTSRTKKKHKPNVRTQMTRVESPLNSLGLTARETEVLTWIAQGKTNYEIGVILSACTGTICKHVEHILCKLDVKNRTAAAAIAFAATTKAKI